MKVLILNGPNLNMLGKRDPAHYGTLTYDALVEYIRRYCRARGLDTEFLQSNSEGQLVTWIQEADCDGMILNAGAYTHYSYAIRDAIECVPYPVVETHLSDIGSREPVRRISVLSDVCIAQVSGKKQDSYTEAAELLIRYLKEK